MWKIYLLVGAIVVGLLSAGGYRLHRALQKGLQAQNDLVLVRGELSATKDALEAVKEARDAEAKVALARQKLLNQRTREAETAKKALHEAIQANRDWADAPVPDSVRRALQSDYSDGVDPAPGPTPGANTGARTAPGLDKR